MLSILAACITMATAGKLKMRDLIRDELRAEMRIHKEEVMQMKLGCSWNEFPAPDGCESCTGICSSVPKDTFCVQMCPVFASIQVSRKIIQTELSVVRSETRESALKRCVEKTYVIIVIVLSILVIISVMTSLYRHQHSTSGETPSVRIEGEVWIKVARFSTPPTEIA